MKKEYEDYHLYNAYSGLCLDKQEYDNISEVKKEINLIPNVFDGEFKCFGGSTFTKVFDDLTIVNKILKCKPKIFLHEAYDSFWQTMSKAYFFYDEFLVIVGVGDILDNKSTIQPGTTTIKNYKYKKSNVKPVIIPYSSIQEVSHEKNLYAGKDDDWIIKIKYKGNTKDTIHLFRAIDVSLISNRQKLASVNSWTQAVNNKLFSFSLEPSLGNETAIKFVAKIEALINASRNIENIEDSIFNYFDSNVAYNISKYKYVPQFFITEILKNKNSIINSEMKEKTERFLKLVSKLNKEKEPIVEELEILKSNLEVAGIFQKGKYKKTIKEENEKLEEINRKQKQELKEFENYVYKTLNISEEKISYNDEISQNEITFYNECQNKKITDPTSSGQKMVFEMLYKKFGYNDYESALYGYQNGKRKDCSANGDKKSRDKSENRTKYIIQYNREKDIANVVGYEKYLKTAKKEYEIASNYAKAAEALSKYASLNSNQKAYQSDSAILGGIANGIAGPAAGLMTAAKVEADNAKRKADVAKSNELFRGYAKEATAFQGAYASQVGSYNGVINNIYKKMIDGSHKEEYMYYLKCHVKDVIKLDKGIIRVKINIKQTKSMVLNEIKFILDGSIKLDIYTDDSKIGDAYINAPGYDNTNIYEVGFKNQEEYEVIGLLNQDVEIEKLVFKFKPYNLWIIEK